MHSSDTAPFLQYSSTSPIQPHPSDIPDPSDTPPPLCFSFTPLLQLHHSVTTPPLCHSPTSLLQPHLFVTVTPFCLSHTSPSRPHLSATAPPLHHRPTSLPQSHLSASVTPLCPSHTSLSEPHFSVSALLACSSWLLSRHWFFVFYSGWTLIVFRCELAILFGVMLIISLVFGGVPITDLIKWVLVTGIISLGES